MKTYLINAITCLLACLMFIQCGKHDNEPRLHAEVLPVAPEYDMTSQWYITDRDAQADIFYITSTETGDYSLQDGTTCHYADTYNDSTRNPILGEMQGVDALLSGSLNYYSPYYRQCSLQTFTSDSLLNQRLPIAIDDVRRAFTYYLNHLNGGRPFVIAGFSQGAIIMLQLMKEMDETTFRRMIAAYAIGVTISRVALDDNHHIIPARGAHDTGVTICYNSVHDTSCAMTGWEHSDVAINPVNWCTDATPAVLITQPSPLIPIDQQRNDTLTVTLDPASGLLLVEGYTGNDYILPLIGKQGNYHSREIWLYRNHLRDNIANRTACYLNSPSLQRP